MNQLTEIIQSVDWTATAVAGFFSVLIAYVLGLIRQQLAAVCAVVSKRYAARRQAWRTHVHIESELLARRPVLLMLRFMRYTQVESIRKTVILVFMAITFISILFAVSSLSGSVRELISILIVALEFLMILMTISLFRFSRHEEIYQKAIDKLTSRDEIPAEDDLVRF